MRLGEAYAHLCVRRVKMLDTEGAAACLRVGCATGGVFSPFVFLEQDLGSQPMGVRVAALMPAVFPAACRDEG